MELTEQERLYMVGVASVRVIWVSMIRAVASYSTHNAAIPGEDVADVVEDGELRSVEEPTWGSDVLVGAGGKNGGE